MKKSLLLVLVALVAVLALVAVVALGVLVAGVAVRPRAHGALDQPRIYAYRDWQSVGVRLHQGDVVSIRAEGEWLYTPGEYHGPQGHARYTAPSFYPLPGVRGGALLGRIGDHGEPFLVGRRTTRLAEGDGMLYLRIDDDILSDNDGYVTVEVTVTEGGRQE